MRVYIDVPARWQFTGIHVFLMPQVTVSFDQGAIGAGDADSANSPQGAVL